MVHDLALLEKKNQKEDFLFPICVFLDPGTAEYCNVNVGPRILVLRLRGLETCTRYPRSAIVNGIRNTSVYSFM